MFDEGSGPPIVVIPGLQGRWEWMKPALWELARGCRAVSYSLCGDFGSGTKVNGSGFDIFVDQLDRVLDTAGVERAAVCGVSFGGFIALRYAASRPSRVNGLILTSAPAPGFNPSVQQTRWLARPWLSAPAFVATAPIRLWPEIRTSLSSWRERVAFAAAQTGRIAAAPMIPSLMSDRMRRTEGVDFQADCRRVQAPVLVVTGEEGLDRVVPVRVTRRYTTIFPGATYEMMEGTGHMGMLTQPKKYARIVSTFVHANHR
ncbi:MAG TPA: alpha/beta hydrolase [Vicinamibacterales bacterium]|nr:alpha/beta hydrolase [Vicinamibacterales bacterium]